MNIKLKKNKIFLQFITTTILLNSINSNDINFLCELCNVIKSESELFRSESKNFCICESCLNEQFNKIIEIKSEIKETKENFFLNKINKKKIIIKFLKLITERLLKKNQKFCEKNKEELDKLSEQNKSLIKKKILEHDLELFEKKINILVQIEQKLENLKLETNFEQDILNIKNTVESYDISKLDDDILLIHALIEKLGAKQESLQERCTTNSSFIYEIVSNSHFLW